METEILGLTFGFGLVRVFKTETEQKFGFRTSLHRIKKEQSRCAVSPFNKMHYTAGQELCKEENSRPVVQRVRNSAGQT